MCNILCKWVTMQKNKRKANMHMLNCKVPLQSEGGSDDAIVTQTPLPDTIIDFWRLIYDHKCHTVISLNRLGTQVHRILNS